MPYANQVFVRSKSLNTADYCSPLKMFDYLASGKFLPGVILQMEISYIKERNFKFRIWTNKGKDNWINVDLYGADINCDLRKGIPIKENTVDKIYTSHMFEHVPFKELKKFINECYRVLKVGGELSVCVPNARFYIDAYLNKETFKNESEMFEPAIVKTGSWMDQINYIAYLNGLHHYMFDEENLINTLKLSPFKKC